MLEKFFASWLTIELMLIGASLYGIGLTLDIPTTPERYLAEISAPMSEEEALEQDVNEIEEDFENMNFDNFEQDFDSFEQDLDALEQELNSM